MTTHEWAEFDEATGTGRCTCGEYLPLELPKAGLMFRHRNEAETWQAYFNLRRFLLRHLPCDHCGAVSGARCRTKSGGRSHWSHAARDRAVRAIERGDTP